MPIKDPDNQGTPEEARIVHKGLSGPVRDQALKECWPFGPGGNEGQVLPHGRGKEAGGRGTRAHWRLRET